MFCFVRTGSGEANKSFVEEFTKCFDENVLSSDRITL